MNGLPFSFAVVRSHEIVDEIRDRIVGGDVGVEFGGVDEKFRMSKGVGVENTRFDDVIGVLTRNRDIRNDGCHILSRKNDLMRKEKKYFFQEIYAN